MRLIPIVIGVVFGLLVQGCQIAHGPGVVNSSIRPIDVSVLYSDGYRCSATIDRGAGVWRRVNGLTIDKLTVTDERHHTEYDGKTIHELLSAVPRTDDAVIAIGEDGLKVITREKLMWMRRRDAGLVVGKEPPDKP
jgi:hypothetical protein